MKCTTLFFIFIQLSFGNPFELALKTNAPKIDLIKCKDTSITYPILSMVGVDKQLIKYAEQATKDKRIQKEIDEIIYKISRGIENVGLGYQISQNGYSYYRGSYGGRVFIKKHKGVIFVIAKASKKGANNENKTMRRLEQLYPDLKFLGRQGI